MRKYYVVLLASLLCGASPAWGGGHGRFGRWVGSGCYGGAPGGYGCAGGGVVVSFGCQGGLSVSYGCSGGMPVSNGCYGGVPASYGCYGGSCYGGAPVSYGSYGSGCYGGVPASYGCSGGAPVSYGCYGSSCYGGVPSSYGSYSQSGAVTSAPPPPVPSQLSGYKEAGHEQRQRAPAERASAERLGPPEEQARVGATIVVSLPAEARLTVNGTLTRAKSATRKFVSPPLEPGKDFHYTLKAEMVRDGQTLAVNKRVAVRAGQEKKVVLEFPPADPAGQ